MNGSSLSSFGSDASVNDFIVSGTDKAGKSVEVRYEVAGQSFIAGDQSARILEALGERFSHVDAIQMHLSVAGQEVQRIIADTSGSRCVFASTLEAE